MFLILKTVYITSYADDNNLSVVADNVKDVVRSLEEVGENMITWCSDNQIKMNIDKCHQLLNT